MGRRLYYLARTRWSDNDLIPINGVKALRNHERPSYVPRRMLVWTLELTSRQPSPENYSGLSNFASKLGCHCRGDGIGLSII